MPKGKTRNGGHENGEHYLQVYLNENGKAVYAGDVTAPSYEEAVAFMTSEGYEEKDYILTRADR